MKGSANCCLDHVEWLRRSGPTKKYGDWIKIAAVERREARVLDRKSTRRLSRGVNLLPKRRPALRSLAHARGKKSEAPPRASLTIGVDGARPYGRTKESENADAGDDDERTTASPARAARARS